VWYLSPLICHTYITGLTYAQTYSFTISAVVTNSNSANTAVPAGTYTTPTQTVSSTATQFTFAAPSAPSSASGPSSSYPINWVLMAGV
jgi:hypothetical protein